jgi:hypothetical protein
MVEATRMSEKKLGLVEAVGTAVTSRDPETGKRLQKAMSDAIAKAYAEGATDPEEVKKRMQAAYQEAKQQ